MRPGRVPSWRSREGRTAWGLVAAQMGLLAVVVASPPGDAWEVPSWLGLVGDAARVGGLGLLVAGLVTLGRSLSPFPVPTPGAQLRTTGVYRLVRHPIYAGLIALAGAWALTSGSVLTVVATGALTGVLLVKARFEEARLEARFPGYVSYAERTPRFVPGARRCFLARGAHRSPGR